MSVDNRVRCVVIGGADIGDYSRVRSCMKDNDYVIYCDSGLKHLEELGVMPSLIVGDFDSYNDPHMDVETIILPVVKDDTDTAFAVKEGMRRGYSEFLLLGVTGARLDHTLVNIYILSSLDNRGCHGIIIDDYSEMEVITGRESASGTSAEGRALINDSYPFFSLIALEGPAEGVSIRDAKYCLEDAEITPDFQYATSNEVLPGKTAEVTVKKGRLLVIRDFQG